LVWALGEKLGSGKVLWAAKLAATIVGSTVTAFAVGNWADVVVNRNDYSVLLATATAVNWLEGASFLRTASLGVGVEGTGSAASKAVVAVLGEDAVSTTELVVVGGVKVVSEGVLLEVFVTARKILAVELSSYSGNGVWGTITALWEGFFLSEGAASSGALIKATSGGAALLVRADGSSVAALLVVGVEGARSAALLSVGFSVGNNKKVLVDVPAAVSSVDTVVFAAKIAITESLVTAAAD
jgi:hypothetical protein